MSLVLDASVILAWALEDEAAPYADSVQEAIIAGGTPIGPCHWPLEVVNGLLAAERRGRIDEAGVNDFLKELKEIPIQTEDIGLPIAAGAVATAARSHVLSAYDAAYVELAKRRDTPLATLDNVLVAAARKSGVKLWRPPRKVQ